MSSSSSSLLQETQETLDGLQVTLSRLRSIEHDVLCFHERFTQAMVVCSGHLVQALSQIEPQQADLHLQQVIKVLSQRELKQSQQSIMGQAMSPPADNNNNDKMKASTTTDRKHASGGGTTRKGVSSELSLQQALDTYLELDQQVRQLESEVESLQRFRDENTVCLARMAIHETKTTAAGSSGNK